MGRPKTIEPRSQQLNLSFTITEITEILQRAHALGMRPAHLGRTLLLARDTEPLRADRISNINRLILDQLRRLGNNLNQIVRHLNQTGDPVPSDLEPLLTDIRELIAKVRP